jgi:RHS repeat-associated protein
MQLRTRACRSVLFLYAFFSLFLTLCQSQVENIADVVSTPVPGSGRDYIRLLNETVDPSSGSVSLRIDVPTPSSRGITLPFRFTYDTGGATNDLFQGKWANNYLQNGGWGYGLPMLRDDVVTMVPNPNPPVNRNAPLCDVHTAFVFTDTSGIRHSLSSGPGLSLANQSICNNVGDGPNTYTTAHDDFVSAWTPSGQVNGVVGPFTILDSAGTIYHFQYITPTCVGGFCGLPDFIEDRNGNKITFTQGNSFPITVTDTAGRSLISIPTFGNSTDSLTIAGQPYTVTWENTNINFALNGTTTGVTGSHCPLGNYIPNNTFTGPATVVSAITLPNGQSYHFYYSGTYGLVNKIVYPSGAYVSYTWGANPRSDRYTYSYNYVTPLYTEVDPCLAESDTLAVLHRYVSFDGVNIAEQQDFSYSTTWALDNAGDPHWTSKQTTITTTDLTRPGHPSYQTVYSYTPYAVPFPPNTPTMTQYQNLLPDNVPHESSIVYKNTDGSTLRTIAKTWSSLDLLGSQAVTLEDGLTTSSTNYAYGPFGVPGEEDDYDFGGSLIRKTINSFVGFPTTPLGATIFQPCKTVTYDGSGNRVAETDYLYDGGTTVCGAAGSPATATVSGLPAGTHDETNYAPTSTAPRGNVTAKLQWANSGISSTTTFTYDETGQVLTMTDPCGNTTCSDVTGSNHTTTYSYVDSYTSGGTPPANTNAYLTKVTNPLGQISNFSYDYSNGQLTVAKDVNAQSTTYQYNDSLARLTQINYPDGGQTTYTYNDTAPNPSITTSKKLDGSRSVTSVSVMDGIGHEIQTQLAGSYFVDLTYDGLGRLYTQSNPHLSGSSASDGTTTYTYDPLGRVMQVLHPDGTSTSTTYSGRAVLSKDEGNGTTNVQRVSQYDAFKELISVCEVTSTSEQGSNPVACGQDIAATGFPTTYTYSPLGDLISVSQGGVSRSFNYDSLSRLVSASNPESGTVCYGTWSNGQCVEGYDANGNLAIKTDARGIITSYQYDNLNRVLSKNYSDGTPSASFTYDTSSENGASNTVGHLTYTQVQSGGSTLAKRSLVAYDQMGRLQKELQCSPTNCGSTPYTLQYSYWPSGDLETVADNLASSPYTLTYNYDTADHLQNITSTWNDSQHPSTLFSAQPYAPFGLSNATLGANIQLQRNYNNRGFLYQETDQGNVIASPTSGAGSATINFSEQFQGTPGSGWVAVGGSEGSVQVGTPGTGSVTINGGEQSRIVNLCKRPADPCPTKVWDEGSVWITVNGTSFLVNYQQGSSGTTIASSLASALNGSSTVTAVASGNTVTVTARTIGTATNYSLSAGSSTSVSVFTSPSFTAAPSGSAMTGGTGPTTVYDNGTLTVIVNNVPVSVSYNSGSTSGSLATALANALNGSLVTTSLNGNTVNMTSVATGQISNYPLSASSSTSNSHFSSPSFTVLASGSTLSGGAIGAADSGTVTLSMNSSPQFAKTVSYGSSDTASSLASKLASAYSGDGSSPVNVASNGSTLTIGAKTTGASTNYSYSFSSTYDTSHFSSSSFQGPSSGSLSGGANQSLTAGTIYSYTLGFEPNGNVASVNDSVIGNWSYGVSGTLGYDDMNRLLYASATSGPCAGMNISWTYDRYGNRWSQSASGSSGCTIALPSLSFTGNNNRIDGWHYDAAGNLLSDGVHSYTYDAEGRISSVDGTTKYVYDAGGRRVAKENGSGAVTASYALGLDGEQVTEMNGSGQWVHSNVYAGKLLATYDGQGTRFQLEDALGSRRVQAHTDGTAGLFCRNYPFGDGLNCWGGDEDSTEQHFTGKERDSESGLDNFGKRYFGSSLGRFQTPDPAGIMRQKLIDPQQWNMYSYARNNPLRFTDPTGKYVCSDNQKCDSKLDKAFEEARQRDLKSKDSAVVAAAKAYGDPTKANGVSVAFAKTLPGSCAGGAGCTQPGITGTATGIAPDVKVTFLNNLSGKGFDQAVAHEGSHTADALQFINSFDASTGKFNGAFNYVHYDTEFKAYAIGASVMKGENYSMGTCGGSPCVFGDRDSIQDTYRKIDELLTDPQSSYKPDLEKLQFDPSFYPQ